MTDERLLPHLAAACNELLGGDDERLPPPSKRAEVAGKADTGQPTVDRFLKAERVPRSEDLDRMVSAVAIVAGTSWLAPWQRAVARAIELGEVEQPSQAQSDPASELQRILGEAVQRYESTGSHTAKPTPASQKT